MVARFSRRKNVCTKPYKVGDFVSVRLPKQERYGTDMLRLPCMVVQVISRTCPRYRLQCQYGVLETTFQAGDLEQYHGTFSQQLQVSGWEKARKVSLREACRMTWNEQSTTRCICKRGCKTKQFRCRKAKRFCSSRCHAGRICQNGSDNKLSQLVNRPTETLLNTQLRLVPNA